MNASKLPNKRFSPFRIWAMSFGCSVGWGAFIMPGTMFLPMAGPLGSSLALFLGALALIVVAANYHYIAQDAPASSGGSYSYIKNILGLDHAYLCTWFLWLLYASIIWANATAVPLVIRNLFGDVLHFGFHYDLMKYDIYGGEVLVSSCCILLGGLLCILRNRTAVFANTCFAMLLLFTVIALFIATYAQSPTLEVFAPPFSPTNSPYFQVFNVVALSPWAFCGFEAISHVRCETKYKGNLTFYLMTAGVLTATLLYILLILIAAMPFSASMDWAHYANVISQAEPGSSTTLDMPVFSIIRERLGTFGLAVLCVSIMSGIMTGVLGLFIALSRLTCAVAEDKILPAWFTKRTSRNIPVNAFIFIIAISIGISFFGRSAIGWIIDVTTVGATLAYFYVSYSAVKKAKQNRNICYAITGWCGIFLSFLLCFFIFMPSFWSIGNLATESYLIFSLWGVLGFVFFLYVFRKDEKERFGQSNLVWLAMLFVIFFSTMMWMRQDIHYTTKNIVNEVSEYYTTRTADEGHTPDDEKLYLQRQMSSFGNNLIKHSLVQMAVVLVSIGVVFTIYSLMQSRRRKVEMEKTKAEEVSRSKSAFLSNMSHDIRTPMNAIIGFTTLALKKDDPVAMRDYLRKIELSSNHLLSLINDVLEMSRIESGKVEMQNGNVSIPDLLHNLNTIIIGQIEAKQQNLDINALGIHDENIICDKLRLNQILLNLLSNAIKYTQAGGHISVNVRQVSSHDDKATYELRIKDNGIGMSPEFAARIFEAFERENTSTVNKIQGTGLGMAITKHLVDLMGGDIRLETEKGKGSEFILTFTFPIVKTKKIPPLPDLKGIHVLVADDDYSACDAITGMLTEMGTRVDWTMSGKEAILRNVDATKRGDPFSLCIIDWKMPDMSGVNVAQEITHSSKTPPAVILITAYDWINIKDEALKAGVRVFCNKPVFASELRACVLKALEFEESVQKTEEKEEISFQGKRILLVDDIDVNREIAVEILSLNDFEVEEACDGKEAVEKVAKADAGYYDVVLMDVQMPVMDGYTATKKIRELADTDKAKTPIVAMTANAFDEDKQAALNAGMNAHIAKPINIETLLETLKKIL